MARKSSAPAFESSTEITDASTGQVVNSFTVPTVTAPTEGALTFEMYCVARRIPVQNRAGMRHFTKLHSATLQEWDKAFKRY